MWLHICVAGPMMAYTCDFTSVWDVQVVCWPTDFCLLLLNAIPYFIYFTQKGLNEDLYPMLLPLYDLKLRQLKSYHKYAIF